MRNRFDTIHAILHYTGFILIVFGGLMLLPLIIVLLNGEFKSAAVLAAFILPSGLSFVAGLFLKIFFREGRPYTLRAILICCLGWIACSAIGALPYVIALGSGYLNAYFETMSGFTTTGMTMLSGLDRMPASILFWRSLTEWLGGLGILGFFLAVGFKGQGAHRLYGAESHKIDVDRPVPGFHNTVRILWTIYLGFTLAVFIGLTAAGMPLFDSLCHSLTTLSTGGYSTHDASIEFYRLSGHPHYVLIEYIIIFGMLLGGINFLVHYRVLTGKIKALFDNAEMKYLWGFIVTAVLVIFLERLISGKVANGIPISMPGAWKSLEENFRIILFQTVSILTTTGFGTRDIASPWFGQTARQIFLVLMFVGGCVGSTSGGFKIFRVVILYRLIKRELFRIRTPRNTVTTIVVDGAVINMDEIQRISAIFFAWIGLIAVGGVITAMLSRYDSLVSVSGMFSAVGNIGPSFIPTAELPRLNPVVKIVYIFGMLAGRLEILPALMLLNFKAWKY